MIDERGIQLEGSAADLADIRAALTACNLDSYRLQRLWEKDGGSSWLGELDLARNFVKSALRRSELLLACDAAREALRRHPLDVELRQRLATALAQMGSTAMARDVLLEILGEGHQDSETLCLLGRTEKDEWISHGGQEALARAFEYYNRAFESSPPDAIYPGINAATLALLRGDPETARRLAGAVLRLCEGGHGGDYWRAASLAEALALLGRLEDARAAYRAAVKLGGSNLREISSTRRQARLLSRALIGKAGGFDECFPNLKLVVFSGHMMDEPGRTPPRFPPRSEPEMKAAIQARLEQIHARIGIASAARGSDILFLEAMIERGGGIHIVLPWDRERFLETSVRLGEEAGDGWAKRFAAVLDAADSVHEIGEFYMPTSPIGFEYCNLVMNGRARLLARWLDLDLSPLTVWDGQPGLPGGTGAFVEYWRGQRTLVNVISLPAVRTEEPRREEPALPNQPESTPAGSTDEQWVLESARQEIAAMLFADIVGYSKLPEAKIPKFIAHFMKSVSRLVAESADAPIFTNTWGDALYFVFSRAAQAGRFALDLRDMVAQTDWARHGLVWEEADGMRPLDIRIGLHAGPAYRHFDPVTRQLSFTGAHVSRAARIEPVTKRGHVFASEEFAALAAAENASGFHCGFVGTVPLAKHYGAFRIYDLSRA